VALAAAVLGILAVKALVHLELLVKETMVAPPLSVGQIMALVVVEVRALLVAMEQLQ
jgi:hypothetical protein